MSKIARGKLMFVIPSLAGGGAEKVLIHMVNNLDKDRYAIHLALFNREGVYCSCLPDNIRVYDLDKKSRYSFLKLVFRLARLFRVTKPDTALSFMGYANLIAILAKLLSLRGFSLIINIQNHLSLSLLHDRCRRIKNFLYRNTFRCADSIVVPSMGLKHDLTENYKLSSEKIKVIHNPINLREIDNLKNAAFTEDKLKEYILASGRLTRQKGYPYLLKAYSLINKDVEEKLVILGEGEERAKLEQLAKKLGVQEKVFFLGFQENPYRFMANATIFVLSSLWEGFAIVVAEAMACGVPVISTDCPSGPGEIITNGENGILVLPGDEKILAEKMLALLKNEILRKKFSDRGRRRAEDFSIGKILSQYESVF